MIHCTQLSKSLVASGPLHYILLSIHWAVTCSSMAAGPPGTIPMEKSFHCVLLLITCLGSGGVSAGSRWVRWKGHPKCERRSPSVLFKDCSVTIPHYGPYTVFYHTDGFFFFIIEA